MNQILSYSLIKNISFFIIFLIAIPLFAKPISPIQTDEKEILTINGKRRAYYQLHNNQLEYHINGPRRIKIYSRRAVPKKVEGEKNFSYDIQIDNNTKFTVKDRQSISKGVTSSQHPGHGYSKSGKYFFNIPSGNHIITITPHQKNSPPILIRMIENKFQNNESGELMTAVDDSTIYLLKIGDTKYKYQKLSDNKSLIFNTEDFSSIKILSRLGFENWMPHQEYYRIRLSQDDKEIGIFYFSTEKSDSSSFLDFRDLIPGKRRTCEYDAKKNTSEFKIELLDKNKTVFLRCIGY